MGIIVFMGTVRARAEDPALDFFEAEIRPILVDKCSGCHGPDRQEGELRIDLRDAILSGGDSGAAIVPGDAAGSLLVQAIRHQDGLEMPPKEELSERVIEAIEHWIDSGAPWPASKESLTVSTIKPSEQAKEHWAFQPVQRPAVPVVADERGWVQNPIDAFTLEKLRANGLSPSPAAGKRSLMRRLSYSLTGLPPSPEDMQQFLDDSSSTAYADLVERFLASPQYGEHWARHWLDVARYSDTKGYVYAREERFWVHAWTYRDWVARAFNEDLPYDRFLLLQLAADQVPDRRQSDLAAMGFLTLGRRFLGVERDIIDDRIDVVCRGTMGLTVACARCHDHKYDPIPTADYYSLYGVFDSSVERLEPLTESLGDDAFEAELKKRQDALQDRLVAARQESSDRVRARVADHLFAQSELDKYPANGFDQIFQADDILPAFVRRWQRFLREAKLANDPVFTVWHAYADLPAEDFATAATAVTEQFQHDESIPAAILRAFATSPQNFREVCDRYGAVFADVNERYQAQANNPQEPSAIEPELLAVLYGPQAPCQVPDGPVVLAETYFASGVLTELWKLQGEVDRWIINSPQPAPHALTLVDQAQPIEPRIFVRGNPLVQGADVPRQFLAALSNGERLPFEHGSGRYELAQDIIDPRNPLTARVLVNRVWTAHFGHGLVTTPSDFGTRAAAPSHPELLDWLADSFIAQGWSVKELQRWIVLSSTFQQSSRGPADASVLSAAIKLDPDNRLLWRMNPRRLTFEEFRDSLISAAGQLDASIGGRPTDLFATPFPLRRTLYGLVDRQFLPGTLRMFDFANPDLHVAQRSETTVPGQALFFLNHPLLLDRARALAASTEPNVARRSVVVSTPDPNVARRSAVVSPPTDNQPDSPDERVEAMFQHVLQRSPSESELTDALALVQAAEETRSTPPRPTIADWQYGYGRLEVASSPMVDFTPLPFFSGSAWQGGTSYPDPSLGWVQLSAEGGHPGNDTDHASVRRWTAPRDGVFRIRSQLTHEPTAGDGIHAAIVHSADGILSDCSLHHDTLEMNHSEIKLSAGQTLDFVVDIKEVLNSDQYLWKITIDEMNAAEQTDVSLVWDSLQDFPNPAPQQLNGWEQLAQVLLCSNEFMFVD
jgi:hypothetical protein